MSECYLKKFNSKNLTDTTNNNSYETYDLIKIIELVKDSELELFKTIQLSGSKDVRIQDNKCS